MVEVGKNIPYRYVRDYYAGNKHGKAFNREPQIAEHLWDLYYTSWMADRYEDFIGTVLTYFAEHGRHGLPWRSAEADGSFDPYKIMVSEVMLQQTQVARVIPKYEAFVRRFPDMHAIAVAPLGGVLAAWQGLGYNRRARYLWQAAHMVEEACGGVLPRDVAGLERLPGIGHNTAGAIMVYAFNEPALFIETNIRTVFIHHFFKGQSDVPEKFIETLLAGILLEFGKSSVVPALAGAGFTSAGANEKSKPEDSHPSADGWGGAGVSHRDFYWALMDYGAHLKQTVGNLSRGARSYKKQSKFSGSKRQLRGQVVRLLANGAMARPELLERLKDERVMSVLEELEGEGLITFADEVYVLP